MQENDVKNMTILSMLKHYYDEPHASEIIDEIKEKYDANKSLDDNMETIKAVIYKHQDNRKADLKTGTAIAIGAGIGIAA